MIEAPPLLTIQKRRNQPTSQQIAAVANYPTGFLVDAMYGYGALPFELRALSPGVLPVEFCGPALTCNPGPADVVALIAALSEVRRGDVIVAATQNWTGCAAVGDRVLGMAKNAGAIGFVTDGLVRDVDGIEKVGLPVYCKGVSANSPFNSGPGTIGMPVSIGDRSIDTGDLMRADRDGVVVIPFARIDEVVKRLETIATTEAELDAKVEAGLILPDAIKALLASDKVRRIG